MSLSQTVVITHVESGMNLAVNSQNSIILRQSNPTDPFQQWKTSREIVQGECTFINVGSGDFLSALGFRRHRYGTTPKIITMDSQRFDWFLIQDKLVGNVPRWRISPYHSPGGEFSVNFDGLTNTVGLGKQINNNTNAWDFTVLRPSQTVVITNSQTVVITHVESGMNLAVNSQNSVILRPSNCTDPFQQWIKGQTDNHGPLGRNPAPRGDPYCFRNVATGTFLSANETQSPVVKVDAEQFYWYLYVAKDARNVPHSRICPFHFYNFSSPRRLKFDGISKTVELCDAGNDGGTTLWDIKNC